MLRKWMTILLLANVLAGLCAPAQANTTVVFTAATPASSASVPVRLAQNDITISPQALRPLPLEGAAPEGAAPVQANAVRIALMLPLQSPALGRLAAMVRDGFLAAHGHGRDQWVSVSVITTSESGTDLLAAYRAAQRDHDIIVGPLLRKDVTAVAMSGAVEKPTIALTQAGASNETDAVLPDKMLSIGLSIEQEARQIAKEAAGGLSGAKAMIVSTNIAWQRRAARAFASQWRQAAPGLQSEALEIGLNGGYLEANTLAQIIKRLHAEKPDVIFAALDAGQAKQLREAIGAEVPMAGTSQLNPLTMQEWITAERLPELNGTRLVDIPWQLQIDHPAVMAYPRLPIDPAHPRTADMERLYALGIDAYRVAREIALRHARFDIDGVTGKLSIAFGEGKPHFERVLSPAIYQDGMVVPADGMR